MIFKERKTYFNISIFLFLIGFKKNVFRTIVSITFFIYIGMLYVLWSLRHKEFQLNKESQVGRCSLDVSLYLCFRMSIQRGFSH
jgi:hypothetical protein